MILLFLAVGLGAGVLSGLFGIGGGIVIVPALMFMGRMSMIDATGTSLGALLLPVGLMGAIEYYRNGHLHLRASLLLAAGLFVGAWIGARFAHQISPLVMKRAFALLLLLVAARVWVSTTGK